MYSVNQVAEILSVHRKTIINWIEAGRINAVKIGWIWRIPEEEVEKIKQGF